MRSGSGVLSAELWHRGAAGGPGRGEFASLGVQLDIVNLNYSVQTGKTKKHLLKDVSFHLEPGDMCALMGPSGAGKSTLLDLIADRKLSGVYTGDILINGRTRSTFFHRDTAYVLQDDIHIPVLTVRETLMYAARMRMEESSTNEQRVNRVKAIIDMLGLAGCAESIVGDAMMKGISGGQLKRLSIGVEIISLPNLIFLDEPTSGLDSAISFEVMKAVSTLSTQNRTIVTTIHQPSPETFALFDKVVLLSAGKLIFMGPADEAVAYFMRPELDYKYEAHMNPAEFIIDVSGGVIYPSSGVGPLRPDQLADIFNSSNYCQKLLDRGSVNSDTTPVYSRKHATTKGTQLRALMHRTWTVTIRSKAEIRMNMIKNIGIGVLVGIVFHDQGKVDELVENAGTNAEALTPEATNVSNLLFFLMMYTVMANLQAIPNLVGMNVLYRRELSAYAYAASPYWLANVIMPIPSLLLYHTIMFVLTFFTVNFGGGAENFFYMYFLLALSNIISYYFAQLLAAGTGSQALALAIFPISFLFFSMFAGFSIKLPNVSDGWEWATYISYPRYIYEGLVISDFDTSNAKYLDEALEFFGFDGYDRMTSFPITLAFGVLFAVLTYLCLRPPRSTLVHTTDKSLLTDAAPIVNVENSTTHDQPLISKSSFDAANAFPTRSTYDVAWYRQSTGDIQQSRGCRLVFRDVEYYVQDKADKKRQLALLNGVSGRVHPGEMCALMGASGAGKSTLLDVLAGRKTTGDIKGQILFNGSPRNPAVMKSSAYVMQDNVHIGVLTVRQTLEFAAALRMEQKYKKSARVARVDKILDMLGLQEVAETIVGTETIRGVSGGQLKRLSIGVEIINLPDLIFLDEPTTGLDSAIAFEVMAAVRNLANQNRTVICTIHQPSPQTFDLFDKLSLMAHGRIIYFGPAKEVVDFFVRSPYEFAYVPGSNVADFVINVAGSFIPARNGKTVPGTELAQYYSKSDLYQLFIDHIDTMIAMDQAAVVSSTAPVKEYPTSVAWQTAVLFKRQMMKLAKDRKPVTTAFFRHIIVAVFYGSLYYHVSDEPSGLIDRLALFFFSLLFMCLGHQQAMPILFEERLLFYRERGAKAYSTFPYFFISALLQFPLTAINVAVFSAILYDMTGMREGSDYFTYFWLVLTLTSYTGLFQCQLIAASTPTAQAAIAIFPASLFWAIAFSGFIVYIPTLDAWLRDWAPDLSFMRWSFQGMCLNEFDGNDDLNTDQLMENLGFDDDNIDKWDCLSYILIFTIIFRGATYFALRYINFEER